MKELKMNMAKKPIQRKNPGDIMETLYIKLNISKSDIETKKIREAGLLFENIVDATGLDRNSIKEINESNYLPEIKNILK